MLNRGIETFLAVVAAGNINKAARLLNITQSSVSQRLKKLEEDVGSVLIDRRKGGRSIQLTHAGESFFLVAENMQAMLQRLSDAPSTGGLVNDNYTSPSATITLPQTGTRRNYRSGALETMFCSCFPDILSA